MVYVQACSRFLPADALSSITELITGTASHFQQGCIAKTFFNLPDGYTLYHKNGDLGDTSLFNLQPIDRKELGRITGAQAMRKPVKKIDINGNVVDFYSSVRAAARAN